MRWLLLSAFVAASCGAGSPEVTSARTTAPTTTAAPPATLAPTAAAATPDARPSYLVTALSDVRTSERFSLGQFGGKVVIVQAMAVW
jgi:hypothetical protein